MNQNAEEINALRHCDRKGPTSYGAYVPDLPGCVAVAKPTAEVKKLIAEAIPLHWERQREDGLPVPEPATECEYVEV